MTHPVFALFRFAGSMAALCAALLLIGPGSAFAADPAPAAQQAATQPQVSAAAPALPPVAAPMQQATPPPQAAPQVKNTNSITGLPDVNLSWSSYFEALALLCFLLALLWAVLWLIKKRGNIQTGGGLFGASGPGLRVENRLSLGPKKWILVISYMDRKLLIGVTDQSMNLLCELPAEEELPAGAKDNGNALLSFASFLGKNKADAEEAKPAEQPQGKE